MIYLTEDIARQRQAILDALLLTHGEHVLDVGAGPGLLVAEIAGLVGNSGQVHGIDISEEMVALARRRCAGFPHVTLSTGDAHSLRDESLSYDAVVCIQVLEYVNDPVQVLREIHRVLRPGGRAIVMATDWDSCVWHCPDPGLTTRIIEAWNGHCPHPHLPGTLGPTLRRCGFSVGECRVVPIVNLGHHENTYSDGIIDLIGNYVTQHSDISETEAANWARGLRGTGERGAYFFSLNRYMFSATRV